MQAVLGVVEGPGDVPPLSATTVCPGGSSIHQGRASSRVWPAGKGYVFPSAMIAA
jgi:hypothetical protein